MAQPDVPYILAVTQSPPNLETEHSVVASRCYGLDNEHNNPHLLCGTLADRDEAFEEV